MKKVIKSFLNFPFKFLFFLSNFYVKCVEIFYKNFSLYTKDFLSSWLESLKETTSAGKPGKNIVIYTPNSLCTYRAKTYLEKEPETILWMEEFGGEGPMYDIGANIGLYSIYYANKFKQNVYAFEPSFFNLKQLSKNIHKNGLSKKVKIIPTPLCQSNQFSKFKLGSTMEGGALSAFGVNFGFDGKEFSTELEYSTLGFSLDFLTENNLLGEKPSLVKVDVDGIEHLILSGAVKTLSDPSVKSVLIEVNENFLTQKENVEKTLKSCGLRFEKKLRGDLVESERFEQTFNQIWVRD